MTTRKHPRDPEELEASIALYEGKIAELESAVAEAKDGGCTVCHVRMRPQMFNEVRRNEAVVQCENCQRILYYVPAPASQSQAS